MMKKGLFKGVSLAGGSINDPVSANYHFEIYTNDAKKQSFTKINERLLLNAKITKRRDGLIVYLKEAEAISEFLKLVSAVMVYFNLKN